MNPTTLRFILLNLSGGIAVLGSYAWCLGVHPEASGRAWGGVPEALKPFYVVSMLLAAAGYFPFTSFVVWRVPAEPAGDGVGQRQFGWPYALVLLPSALWMPLTLWMLASPSPLLWVIIRIALFAVGLGSLGILLRLIGARPPRPDWSWRLALAGSLAFCVQTAVLDALVWPAYFP